MSISRARALSWRLARQFLADGAGSAEEVVGRLGAVGAFSGDPDLAIRRRLADPGSDDLARALRAGRLMKTYGFRGSTNLMTPADAGTYMALRAAGRQWELPSWVDHYKLRPADWPALRAIVRELVADGPVTRDELSAGVVAHEGFGHLGPAFAHTSDTFLKPFAWQGDICFGPVVDGRPTYQSPEACPSWRGIPELDDAGRSAVLAYFDAYGPATPEHLHYWLGQGLSAGRKRINRWLADLSGELAEIDVDGETLLHAARHADSLDAQPITETVTLLPGHDQWVLGPGTADERIVPKSRRAAVTRGANLVLATGVVGGTWRAGSGELTVSWFAEAGDPPRGLIEAEAKRLGGLLGRELALRVELG